MKDLALVFVIACGGGGSRTSTTSPPVDPVRMQEPVATEPAKPEPAKPPEPVKDVKAELLAAETAAYDKAKPVFDKWCAKCHVKGGKLATAKKLGHFDMTTYPFGGHHAMEIGGEIRKSLGVGSGKATMPFDKKGAVTGRELELIKAWADAFDASHTGGAHGDHGTQ